MTNLDSILKTREIALLTKFTIVKAMVFPVIMCRCESWTIWKAECWRIDSFQLWCWRRLLRVPWTAKRSNQPILNETNPEYSFEGLMLKWSSNTLATWCEEPTHWKSPWCWERLNVGQEGDDRVWDGWMTSPTQWTWVWANSGRWWRTGKPVKWRWSRGKYIDKMPRWGFVKLPEVAIEFAPNIPYITEKKEI